MTRWKHIGGVLMAYAFRARQSPIVVFAVYSATGGSPQGWALTIPPSTKPDAPLITMSRRGPAESNAVMLLAIFTRSGEVLLKSVVLAEAWWSGG
ncbi:hypothetical protein [Streptomyces sp. NPDC058694]|uniref:hypothetical protein n=1 Tax=Streptomyces sp. NPDC058694 TaxID=3346603 RepID=UPI00365C8AF6